MLRALVAALLLANLAFWAWSAGALNGLGLGPSQERDPARLMQQVRPDAVRVVPATPGTAAPAAASAPVSAGARAGPACLEAGPFAAAAIDAAERAIATAGLPEGAWARTSHDLAAVYAVVLGPFGKRDALQKKREEVGRLNLPFEELDLPGEAGAAPQLGFALGRYDSQASANAALASFNQRNVRTARVALLRPASSENRLRVASATPAMAERLRGLSGAALGAGFAPCGAPSLSAPTVATR